MSTPLTAEFAHAPVTDKTPSTTTTTSRRKKPSLPAPNPDDPPCSTPVSVFAAGPHAPGLRLVANRHTGLTREQSDAWAHTFSALFDTSDPFRTHSTREIVRKIAPLILHPDQWGDVDNGGGVKECIIMVGEECHCDDLAGDEAEDGGVKEDESMEEVGEPLTEEEGARMKRELTLTHLTMAAAIIQCLTICAQNRLAKLPTIDTEKCANWHYQKLMRRHFVENPVCDDHQRRIMGIVADWFNINCRNPKCWQHHPDCQYLFAFPKRSLLKHADGEYNAKFLIIVHNLLISKHVSKLRGEGGEPAVEDFVDRVRNNKPGNANQATSASAASPRKWGTPPDPEIMQERDFASHDRKLIEAIYDFCRLCRRIAGGMKRYKMMTPEEEDQLRIIREWEKEMGEDSHRGILPEEKGEKPSRRKRTAWKLEKPGEDCTRPKDGRRGGWGSAIDWAWDEALEALKAVDRGLVINK